MYIQRKQTLLKCAGLLSSIMKPSSGQDQCSNSTTKTLIIVILACQLWHELKIFLLLLLTLYLIISMALYSYIKMKDRRLKKTREVVRKTIVRKK